MSIRMICWFVAGGVALVAPAATAQPRAAASHLIFASNRDGETHVYAISPAGGPLRALTVGSRRERDLVVSRDGRHLAFWRAVHRDAIVYVADGAGRHVIRVGEGTPAGWSPDGSLLAYYSGGGASGEPIRLAIVRADGSGARTLVGDRGSFTVEGWSRDGSELAFTCEAVTTTGDSYTQLWTVDRAGEERLVDSQLGENWFSAAWSPRDDELAYRRFAHGGMETVVADVRAGTARVLAEGRQLGAPVWSPDGSKVLFSVSGADGKTTLVVADPATGTGSTLASTAEILYEQTPSYAWSPRGDRVAWYDVHGLFDVSADGRNRKQLRPAGWLFPRAGDSPIWSPSGDRLAFERDGLQTIRPDGTGLRTLANRGAIQLLGWVAGAVPSGARAAPPLPAVERASTRLLRLRGRVKELVAAGAVAGVVSGTSRLDCVHVLAWSPRASAVGRASRPVPCDPQLLPSERLVGGLEISGTSLSWSSDWGCGNTECDRVAYGGLLRGPRQLVDRERIVTVQFDGAPPKLPCVVCPEPNPTSSHPDVVRGHAAVYVRGSVIVIRLPHKSKLRMIRPPGGPVYARLTRAGLFYSYSVAGTAYPGRVAFVPLDAVG